MINQESDLGKAKLLPRNNVHPNPGNKDSVKRQSYQSEKDPELPSLPEPKPRVVHYRYSSYMKKRTGWIAPQYKDTEDTDPDNLLHCPECGAKWGGKCPLHGVLHLITDVSVPRHFGNTLRPYLTTPYVVNINTLPTGETEVTARMAIPIRTRFGPYEGQVVSLENASEYAWLIRRNGKPDHCVDAQDPGLSNWMRHVQSAPQKGDENLLAFQYQGKLFYMTLRNIHPGEKLLVWCGSKYKQRNDKQGADSEEIAIGLKVEAHDDVKKGDLPNLDIQNPTDSAAGYIKREAEDNASNHETVEVKQEVEDDSFCEGLTEKECRKEDDLSCHASGNVILGIEEECKNVKLEIVDVCKSETSFIKEEVKCNQGGLEDEVCRSAMDVSADLFKSSDRDFMDLDCADFMEVDSGNETVASEESASTNVYNACCSSLSVAVEGTVAKVDDLKGDITTVVEVLTGMHSKAEPGKKILSCSDCKKFFGSNFALDRHVQMRHRSKPLESRSAIEDPIGEKTQSTAVKDSSQSRSEGKPQSRVVSCCECKQNFDGSFALYRHIQTHHRSESSRTGHLVGEKTESFTYKISSQSCSEGKPKSRIVSCSECNRFFEGNIALDRHIQSHHRISADKSSAQMGLGSQLKSKIVSCIDCKKFFEGAVALNRHMQMSHLSKLLETAAAVEGIQKENIACSASAVEDIQKENIASTAAEDSSPKLSEAQSRKNALTCRDCSKSFASKFLLNRHLEEHRASKPFYRGVSKVSFDCKSDLTEHRLKDKRLGCNERIKYCLSEGKHQNFRSGGKAVPFFCPQRDCFQRFTTRRGYHKHVLKHKTQMAAKCPKCLKEFGSQANLNVHLKRSVCRYLPYVCSKCRTAFGDHAALEEHSCVTNTQDNGNVPPQGGSENQLIKKPYRCNDCNLHYDSRHELSGHFRLSHKSQNPIFCVYCTKEYSNYYVLRKHVRRVHTKERSYLCKICNKEFFAAADLRRHSVIHSCEKTYTCVICVKLFYSNSELSKHLEVHKNKLNCRFCNRQFSSYLEVKHHLDQKHSSAMIFECLVCEEKFPYQSDLKDHLEFHVRGKLAPQAADVPVVKESNKSVTSFDKVESDLLEKKEDFYCTDCERAFSDEQALLNHVCTLRSQKERLECNKCSEKFSTSRDLERHNSCHQDGRPYLCVECNSGFSCQTLLDEHQCIHNNERPVACSECDRRFWSDAAYKTHLRTHVNKTHVCSVCAKSFSHPEHLEAHIYTHSKGTTFICLECDPGLNEKYWLNMPVAMQQDEVNNASLTCCRCDKTVSYDTLSEQASQDHRPFEFVSCEPD